MKKTLTKYFSLLCILLLSLGSTHAQQMISGVVSDAGNGDPLIGANVLVKDSDVGTITDIDGSFTLNVPAGAEALMISYTGYADQMVSLTGQSSYAIALAQGELLNEVVVVGYGSQTAKEVTGSVVSVSEEEFNQGPINDPAQLLQGKVAGLQVYNRGGDPNGNSTIRLRGISTVGANAEPLVVIDGVIGASLDNVDPNDIESVDVLKDGSASAIYGSRGSSGVIIVTTKKGSQREGNGMNISYSGQYGVSDILQSVDVMTADEFVAAGGTDLGARVNYLDEVTRQGTSNIHSIAASGGAGNTNYRVSANIRNVDGILQNSGFDQFNTRVNFSTKALNDKLSINFQSSFTNREQQFGFNEALRYATTFNPTAPINGEDSPFPFNSDQYGGYFQTLGLFDSFNPVGIVDQNRNDGRRQEFNYGATLKYNILDNLSANFRIARQTTDINNTAYYPTTSFFRGNAVSPTRKGRADLYSQQNEFDLYEAFATYLLDVGGSSSLSITGGYSFQENNFFDNFLSIGDFPDDSKEFVNIIETAQDLNTGGFINANSNASPADRIIAFFGRVNYNFDDAIFVNASIRREGATKLGADNRWGWFPAVSAGVDLNKYLDLNSVDLLKLRVGYGVTGSLPIDNGLSQELRSVVNGTDGSVTTQLLRAANPDLKWEEKGELNLGVDFQAGKLGGSLDVYDRTISDFIIERDVDAAVFGVGRRVENAGQLNTQGLELALNYDVVGNDKITWNTGVVFSTYKTVLEEYVIPQETRAVLGAPGQNETEMILVREGEEIGQIWGPIFDGVDDNGSPTFLDVNGDETINVDQANALADDVDFAVLGNGIPDFELGWTNQLTIGQWSVNAFFRGAFGHSLVNTFRAFYEPRIASQSSYNYVNTDLAEEGLTEAKFSSLYVEKADFFKLDNFTVSRNVTLPASSPIGNLNVSLTGQNLFVITNYTGADPEPSLTDFGPVDNGNVLDTSRPDVLSPGIDRRNNYFSARTITLGLKFNF